MNVPEIASVISAVKSAAEIARSVLDSTRDEKVRSKILDLQCIISDLQLAVFGLKNIILSLQDDNMNLMNKIEDLEKQIKEQEQWRKTERSYELVSLGTGSQAYRYKPEEGSDTPEHYLCADCFSRRKKSFLQKAGYAPDGALYKCFRCQAQVIDYSDKPPHVDPVVRLKRPFSDF
jgi:hypothetical protein